MTDAQIRQALAQWAAEFERLHTQKTFERLFKTMVTKKNDWHPSH
jgi:hypothetical protein